TTSARSTAARNALRLSSRSSPNTVWNATGIPSVPSCWLSHRLLVSSPCPLTSSLPIAMISARIGGPHPTFIVLCYDPPGRHNRTRRGEKPNLTARDGPGTMPFPPVKIQGHHALAAPARERASRLFPVEPRGCHS